MRTYILEARVLGLLALHLEALVAHLLLMLYVVVVVVGGGGVSFGRGGASTGGEGGGRGAVARCRQTPNAKRHLTCLLPQHKRYHNWHTDSLYIPGSRPSS